MKAVEQGINFFDVSPYYGRTKAETVLGKALRQLPRESFVISTKVGRYDKQSFDFSPQRVTRSVEESMQRLGVDYIDIIQCHDIEFVNLDMIISETLPALLELKKAGKVRAIGITGYPLEIFPYIITAMEPGTIDVVLSYCNYCLQNDRLSLLFGGLRRAGVSVINASPLCMGLLTHSGGPDWHPADAETKAAAKAAAAFCEERDVSLPTVAMQFALQADEKEVVTTLVGIDSVATLQKNITVASSTPDQSLLDDVKTIFDPVRNRRWTSGKFLGSSV